MAKQGRTCPIQGVKYARTGRGTARKDIPFCQAEKTLERASFRPQVILFVGTPFQISRILHLDAFETGEIDTVHGEPLCSGVIAAPITTGKIGISFLDMTCRAFGRYRAEEMAIGVPYPRLTRIISSIELSSSGTARSDVLLKLLARIPTPGKG